MPGQVNYASSYAQELANAYPSVLFSGALWNTENSSKYRVGEDAKTVYIPTMSTTGRVNGDIETIGGKKRNWSNDWEAKTLSNHRTWGTLVHPKHVMETNKVASIANITKTFNEEQKFPEMDAYLFSKIYQLRNAQAAITKETAELTPTTALAKFDVMMDAMDEALVPMAGRILYVDTYTKTLLDNAIAIVRTNGDKVLSRTVSRLDEVDIQSVPTRIFKTAYVFNDGATEGQKDGGFEPAVDAAQMAMMLVHPSSILPIVSYEFAQLDEPSAMSDGKYVYFEESFEDVFILNKRKDAIQICVKK